MRDDTTYDLALLLHLLGVLTLIAGVVVAGVAFEAARRRRQAAEVALLLGLARVGVLLVAIGSALAGAFGLWLVHLGRWGYGSGWVQASIGLYLAALALGGLGGRRPKQARRLARELARHDAPLSQQARARLDDRLARGANYGSLLLLAVVVALMVFKP